MANNLRLSDLNKDESNTIGFVVSCLFSSAIDLHELKQWATSVVERLDVEAIPDYIFELIEFDGLPLGI